MSPTNYQITISLAQQRLFLEHDKQLVSAFPVATSRFGAGEKQGSYCTPRGAHLIRAKIGTNVPKYAVFKGRRWIQGAVWSPLTHDSTQDWILTRILWLSGLEVGKNRLRTVDSMRRYIYIHGAPDFLVPDEPHQAPDGGSHGCIRMRNDDVLRLFNLVPCYTPVFIY